MLTTKKSIHIKLLSGTHAGLKAQAGRLGLTMQAIIDELAALVAQGDPYIIKHLEEMARMRKEREARALASTDADSLLDHLELLRDIEKK